MPCLGEALLKTMVTIPLLSLPPSPSPLPLSIYIFLSSPFTILFIFTTATKRPLHIQLTNNLECETPRITLKRDTTIPEFNHDMELTLDALPATLAARNKYENERKRGRYQEKEREREDNKLILCFIFISVQ